MLGEVLLVFAVVEAGVDEADDVDDPPAEPLIVVADCAPATYDVANEHSAAQVRAIFRRVGVWRKTMGYISFRLSNVDGESTVVRPTPQPTIERAYCLGRADEGVIERV